MAGGGWSTAPFDLLWLVIEILPIADYIRFGSVCTSWRAALSEKRRPPAPQVPWLFIPARGTGCPHLLSFSERKMYPILEPPELAPLKYIGTSKGWLITVDKFAHTRIFDPISCSHFPLPSMTTIPGGSPYSRIHLSFPKIIISARSPAFVAAAISDYTRAGDLFFARKDDDSWIKIDSPKGYQFGFSDIIFYRKQLYAVTRIGQVAAFDLSDPSRAPAITLMVQSPCPQHHHSMAISLVESSSGHLFQLWGEEIRPETIRAFKMNPDSKFVEVTSVGEDACFSGCRSDPIVVSKQHQKGLKLKSKCLYFTITPRVTMYNMENGRWVPPITHGRQSYRPLMWFTPRLDPSSFSKTPLHLSVIAPPVLKNNKRRRKNVLELWWTDCLVSTKSLEEAS